MSCDLDVDTGGLREAAAELRHAAARFRGSRGPHTYPSEHAAGAGPDGRQALRVITARTAQAAESAAAAGGTADHLASLLSAAAERFDAAEAQCTAGG